MKFLIVLAGLAAALLRGNNEDKLNADKKTQSISSDSIEKSKILELKSFILKATLSDRTYVLDFQHQCEDFIEKYTSQADQIKQTIKFTKDQLEVLKSEEFHEKISQIELKIREFTGKIQDLTQKTMNEEIENSKYIENNIKNILEISEALDYLKKIENSDPDHTEELLSGINNVEETLIEEVSLNNPQFIMHNPLYSSIISDLLHQKSQVQQQISFVEQEKERLQNFVDILKAQLDSANSLAALKVLQCEGNKKLIEEIQNLYQAVIHN